MRYTVKKVLPFKEIRCLTVQLCVTHICKHEMLICKERKLMMNQQTIGKIRTISLFSQSQLPLSNSILTRLTSLSIMISRIELTNQIGTDLRNLITQIKHDPLLFFEFEAKSVRLHQCNTVYRPYENYFSNSF